MKHRQTTQFGKWRQDKGLILNDDTPSRALTCAPAQCVIEERCEIVAQRARLQMRLYLLQKSHLGASSHAF